MGEKHGGKVSCTLGLGSNTVIRYTGVFKNSQCHLHYHDINKKCCAMCINCVCVFEDAIKVITGLFVNM